jgi:hypothetical protein
MGTSATQRFSLDHSGPSEEHAVGSGAQTTCPPRLSQGGQSLVFGTRCAGGKPHTFGQTPLAFYITCIYQPCVHSQCSSGPWLINDNVMQTWATTSSRVFQTPFPMCTTSLGC